MKIARLLVLSICIYLCFELIDGLLHFFITDKYMKNYISFFVNNNIVRSPEEITKQAELFSPPIIVKVLSILLQFALIYSVLAWFYFKNRILKKINLQFYILLIVQLIYNLQNSNLYHPNAFFFSFTIVMATLINISVFFVISRIVLSRPVQ